MTIRARRDEPERQTTSSSVLRRLRAVARELTSEEQEPETLEALASLLDEMERELGLD